jgi:hypothetical protein
MAGLVCLSLAVTLYSSYTLRPTSEPRKVKEGFCPICGKELSRTGECVNCLAMQARDPLKRNASRPATGTDYFLVGLLLFLIAGSAVLLLRQVRVNRGVNTRKPSLYTRCPKCKRRLRYSTTKIGKEILCPTCRYAMVAPWVRGVQA